MISILPIWIYVLRNAELSRLSVIEAHLWSAIDEFFELCNSPVFASVLKLQSTDRNREICQKSEATTIHFAKILVK